MLFGAHGPVVIVGAVQVIDETKRGVAIDGRLVVEVVASRRPREAGQVVAAVLVQGEHDHLEHPDPEGDHMTGHYEWSDEDGQQVAYDVFQWMAVDGHYCHWGSPLVVLLVDVFVDGTVVEQPACRCRLMDVGHGVLHAILW